MFIGLSVYFFKIINEQLQDPLQVVLIAKMKIEWKKILFYENYELLSLKIKSKI